MRTIAVFLALTLASLSDAVGQVRQPATGDRSGSVSLITEAALLVRVVGSEVGANPVGASAGLSYRLSPRYALGGSATYVVRDPDDLVSGSGLDYVGYAGLQARARAWLTPSLTLDVAPGLILLAHGEQVLCEVRAPECDKSVTWGTRIVSLWGPGFTFDVAVGYRDLAAALVRLDVMRYDQLTVMSLPGSGPVPVPSTRAESGSRTDLFVGVRAGSTAGMVAAPVLAVTLVLLRALTRG